jgi:hypothetical protein
MNKMILIAVITISSLFAQSAMAFLTPYQADEIIQVMNNVCGDTWCEGDYEFDFKTINCSAATQTCEIQLAVIDPTAAPVNGSLVPVAEEICNLENVKRYYDIVARGELRSHVYEQLNGCISDIEGKL